jgi:hypothetical protein
MVITTRNRIYALFALSFGAAQSMIAAEPNETFATATLLGNGVLSVTDSLFGGTIDAPDTLLGAVDLFGQIFATDDDSSPLGSGTASALFELDTNSGTLDFYVSGFGDSSFTGEHAESGQFRAYVDVYDFFGDPVESFFVESALEPGIPQRFTFSDAAWIGGVYDVILDNTIGSSYSGGDVDFFRFSGLTPGANFTAETSDPTATDLDTLLGWYSSAGALLEFNDDYDPENTFMSRLTGVVPANGQLYFAVAGVGDDLFTGAHGETGDYVLSVALQSASPPGDFNGDTFVNAADYTTWRDGLGTTFTAADYNLWRSNFGPSAAVAASAVPEPSAIALVIALISAITGLQRSPRRSGVNAAATGESN